VAVSRLHSNISASWRTDASIKLSMVASSLTTVSARAMLNALIAGEQDPRALADLAKGKMPAKIPALTKALTGHFDAGHAQLVRSMLHRLELVEDALAELDALLATAFAPWAHQLELLQTIPGVGEKVAQVILAETGGDMSRFPSAAHLAAWAGVAPGVHESAGKRHPVTARHGNRWLTAMLVEAAGSVGRMKGANYLSAQHARLTARRGMGRAQVAVAHSILVSAYWMLTRDEPYADLGADWLARRNDEAHARRLVAQLERLGHIVVLDSAA
jgi:transposase